MSERSRPPFLTPLSVLHASDRADQEERLSVEMEEARRCAESERYEPELNDWNWGMR